MAPKIVILDEKEVHLMGSYVGVVWNTHPERRQIKGEDGLTYRAEVPVRSGDPYIDFISIREYDNDTPVEDEDSPVQGGLSVDAAARVAIELTEAIEYIKRVSKEGK